MVAAIVTVAVVVEIITETVDRPHYSDLVFPNTVNNKEFLNQWHLHIAINFKT